MPTEATGSRATMSLMDECLDLQCPYCGEAVELCVDLGGASQQAYVEDCPVCCRPWQVEAWTENDGTWNAALRTADE